MKRFKKVLLALVTIIALAVTALPVTSQAAGLNDPGYGITTTTIRNVKVVSKKDVYSKWYRLTEPYVCRKEGETAAFGKTKTVTVSSTIEATIPIKSIEVTLGKTIEKSVASTIIAGNSAPLKKGQYAAFYYRKHWIDYTVTYEVIKTTTYPAYSGKQTEVVCSCVKKTFSVAQKETGNDYGWFYAPRYSKLPLTLPKETQTTIK